MAAFFAPASAILLAPRNAAVLNPGRRELLTSLAMSAGTAAVAVEAFARNRALAAKAASPVALFPMKLPAGYENWGAGLVRKPITPLREFYVMSKNTVDPAPGPENWRLRIQFDGRTVRELSYAQLLSFRREERYVSLRCVSNSLKSNLMGTGYWSGLSLRQIIRREDLPAGISEMAVVGLDGHG
jgi:DMSO/TMAO reductase YedYZ molybdopterin-dependent catalytic subunit